MIDTALVYLFAGTALVAAVLMLLLRHPMRVALALIACMLSLAGIYALLGVHVIAVFQVLVYVGAVMVFMVYAIMLLDARDGAATARFSRLLLPGVVGIVALLAILVHGLSSFLPAASATPASSVFSVKSFSAAFLGEYWLHFELVSVLLLAAIVAALAVLEVGRRPRG
jgi:NADH-quinone oxidoreductase subunit J